jgi:mannitol-specific phosphotransferase system IIBC component
VTLAKIKLGIIITLFATTALLGWQYRAQIQRAAQLAADVAQYKSSLLTERQATQEALKEKNKIEKIMLEREQARQELTVKNTELQQELEKLRLENENIKNWSAAAVPDELIRLLEQSDNSND